MNLFSSCVQSGYGTVLYFTDEGVVEEAKTKFPSYKDRFEEWADNSQGILQATIWTALAVEGIRANLQHYHPLINNAVRTEWNIPETWSTSFAQLIWIGARGLTPVIFTFTEFSAQAPFGVAADGWQPPEKQVVPLDERVKVFQ
jgi:predicted oxidoreductase (fatty acid repression mutant protein)